MSKKKVIIIDDERLARVELKNILSGFPEIQVIGEANNAEEGIILIQEKKPDLIFLDVQMPEQSGFDMLEDLDNSPPVIFVTAYDEYAIKAFEFNALDYILKPITESRLSDAIKRIETKTIEAKISFSKALKTDLPFPDQLYLKEGSKSYFVKLIDITLFSSFGNYIKVHFDNKSLLVHRSLNQIEKRLPKDSFFRANRYSIVNIHKVLEIKQTMKSKLKFVLAGDLEIECSERKSQVFRDRWGI